MRDFNDSDRTKKSTRIRIQKNPGNLSEEILSQLERKVKTSLKDGYLSCPVAWKIAREFKVPKKAVGEIADRVGSRITNCQLGCFKVEKTPYIESAHKNLDDKVMAMLEELQENNKIPCAKVFDLARQFKLKPLAVAHAMGALGLKISNCQLGCF